LIGSAPAVRLPEGGEMASFWASRQVIVQIVTTNGSRAGQT
jgi:hypothetical protein